MPPCDPASMLAAIWAKGPEALASGGQPYPWSAHAFDAAVGIGHLFDHYLCARLKRLIVTRLAPGNEPRARAILQYAAAVHDLGKISPLFQSQAHADDRPWTATMTARLSAVGLPAGSGLLAGAARSAGGKSGLRRHEHLSQRILHCSDQTSETRLLDLVALAAGGHHGRWLDTDQRTEQRIGELLTWPWSDVQAHARDEMARGVGVTPEEAAELRRQPVDAVVAIIVSGLVTLADWLVSDDLVVQAGHRLIEDGHDAADGTEWMARRADGIDTHITRTLGTYRTPPDPTKAILGRHASSPRPLQQSVIEARGALDGLWICAYPTGEGKTEAALLRHVHEDEGILFALPTRATADAMHARLATPFASAGVHVHLSHGYASTLSAASDGCGTGAGSPWYTTAVRRLLAPATAMTHDQVLIGASPQRWSALRLMALANHHVVIDEVHTLDFFQTTLLKELLTWWGATGTRVSLLSATLPEVRRRELTAAYDEGLRRSEPEGDHDKPQPAYPYHLSLSSRGVQVTEPPLSGNRADFATEVTVTSDPLQAHAEHHESARRSEPRAHVAAVVNTVDRAITLTRAIAADYPHLDVVCLHSRMTGMHRQDVADRLVKDLGPHSSCRTPLTVIGTQVLEASLDIDVDEMSTDLAPAPSLIQRRGRQYRFGRSAARQERLTDPSPRPLAVIAAGEGGPGASLDLRQALPYFGSELTRVLHYLQANPRLRVPGDLQDFVDQTSFSLEHYWELAEHGTEDELARATLEMDKAALATSRLAALVAPRGRAPRVTYSQLVDLTRGDLADAELVTRFIDRPSRTYLLMDSAGTTTRLAPFASPTEIGQAAPARAMEMLKYTIPVSGALDVALYNAHEQWRGSNSWHPTARALRSIYPVDLQTLISTQVATYCDRTGLTPWLHEGKS